MANGDTLKYRVDQLEKKVDGLDDKIDKIMTNHLPHLELAMQELKLQIMKASTKVNILSTLNILAILVAIVVGVLLK